MKVDGNRIIFSTGRVEHPHCGIIGIGLYHDVGDGYDSMMHEPKEEWQDADSYKGLTKEERTELADHMIERWEDFKQQ